MFAALCLCVLVYLFLFCFQYVCLIVVLFAHLLVVSSQDYWFIYLFVCPSVCLSVCIFVCLFCSCLQPLGTFWAPLGPIAFSCFDENNNFQHIFCLPVVKCHTRPTIMLKKQGQQKGKQQLPKALETTEIDPPGKKNKIIGPGRARNPRIGADEQARRSKPKAQRPPRNTKQTHNHPKRHTERKQTTKMHKTCQLGVASGCPKISVLHDI